MLQIYDLHRFPLSSHVFYDGLIFLDHHLVYALRVVQDVQQLVGIAHGGLLYYHLLVFTVVQDQLLDLLLFHFFVFLDHDGLAGGPMRLVVFVQVDAVLELEVALAAGVQFAKEFHGVFDEFVFRGEHF